MTPEAVDYLRGLKRIEKVALCNKCEISIRWLENLLYANRQPSPELAVRLEKASNGHLTRQALRPDLDWALIGSSIPEKAKKVSE